MSSPSKGRKPKPVSNGQRIKAVVRKLPPNLPEEVFWRSCELWVNDNTVKEKWFRKGAMKGARLSTTSLMSRAYIAFNSPEELAAFSQNYDGHLFRDKQGNEYCAIVEFAPSQKLPVANPKVDARQGTINDDEDYKSFLALLEKGENPSKEKATSQITTDPSKPESTPLLEALITSKHANSTHKSGKQKAAHAHPSKATKAEDDVHFSRAQPIVPSGPITLLKGDNSTKTTAANPSSPAIAKSPQITAKDVGGGRGRGRGKPIPQASSRANKGDGGKKPVGKVDDDATSVAGSTIAGGKGEGSSKRVQDKRKRPSATGEDTSKKVATNNENLDAQGEGAGSSAAAERDTSRGRGRGRGGRGRGGPPVVVVPKILTKIIAEGSGSKPTSTPTTSTSTDIPTVQESTTTTTPIVVSDATSGGKAVDDSGDGENEGPPQPASIPHRDGRVRRPYYGRGRGRGRGANRGGPNPAS